MVNDLKERLLLWKEWEPPKLIERDIRLPEGNDIIAIIGPRRSGKTYLMFQIIKNLINNGVPKENILYINFDDIVFRKYDLNKIFETYFELFNPKGNIYLFFDEVQELKDYPVWLRTLHDRGYKIFITGSSSKLMIKEISKELRGRYISKILLPFSFKEFLKLKNFKFEDTSEKRGKIKNLLLEYLKFGGFPEVLLIENNIDKIEKLNSIYETTFYRDFVERYKIREINIAKELLEYLISNISNFISISRIYNIFKSININVSKRTLWKYYNYILESLILFESRLYTYSKRKEIINPRKIYVNDLGIANLFKDYEIGYLMENLVYLELFRKGIEPNYLKINGKEIDFLYKENNLLKLIEVTYEVDEEHINKVKKALDFLKISESLIISWNEENEIKYNNKKINIIPLWKFLLNTTL
ncbi:ATPase [Nanoarchaeota archaeon]